MMVRESKGRFGTVGDSGKAMVWDKRRLLKVLLDPRTLSYLINAQLRMGLKARVPFSVRLRGRARIAGDGKVVIGEGVTLVGTVVPIELLAVGDGRISVGGQTFINYGVSISAHQEVNIGRRCKIGHYVFVMDNNQHDLVDRWSLPPSRPVVIEDDVWIGAHSIILPGVRIGKNAVIGAGSLVNKDVPAGCLVAGNPARVKRQLIAEPPLV